MNPSGLLRKCLMISGTVLLLLILFETGLRLAGYPATYTSIFTFDEELGYRFQPGEHSFHSGEHWLHVSVDEKGVIDRTEGKPQVLILSDGLVAGLELAARDRLAQLVRENTGLEVINLSVPGYGTVQQWLILRRWLAAGVVPDHVVVVYNFVNDYADNVPQWEKNRVPGLIRISEETVVTEPVLPPRWERVVRQEGWQSRVLSLGRRLNHIFHPVKPALVWQQALLFSTTATPESQLADKAARLVSVKLNALQREYGFRLTWIGWHDYGLEQRAGITEAMRIVARKRFASLTGAELLVSEAIEPPGSRERLQAWEQRWLSPGTRHAGRAATVELAKLIGSALGEPQIVIR